MAVAKKDMGSSTSSGIWKVKGSIFFLFFSLSLCNSTSSLELGLRSARIEIGSGLGSGVERPWTNYSRSRHYDYRRDDLWTRSMGMTLPLCAGSTYVSWFRGVSRERSLVRFLFLLFYIFSTIHLANLNKCFLQYRSILNRKSTWNNFLTPRVKKRSPIKRNERFIRFVDCVQGRVVSANRRSRVNKSSRIIPLGVGGPVTGSAILWNLTVREQRCTRFEAHRLVRRWMVLDVIAREITRRFQRALSRHLLLFPPPSFTLHRSPSPPARHNLSSPEVHRYFTAIHAPFLAASPNKTFVEKPAFLPRPLLRTTPVASKGASSHIPFAPIFHKRY